MPSEKYEGDSAFAIDGRNRCEAEVAWHLRVGLLVGIMSLVSMMRLDLRHFIFSGQAHGLGHGLIEFPQIVDGFSYFVMPFLHCFWRTLEVRPRRG